MKKILLLFIISVLCTHLYSQKTENEKITDIRAWYKTIVSETDSYEKKMLEDPDESTEGGMISYYLKEDAVKLIKAEYYGESGNVTFHYYFKNNKLFFMFKVQVIYDVPIYVDDSGKGQIEENRFYFYEDRMIRWLDKDKKPVDKASKIFSEQERSILKDVDDYLNKL